MEKLVGQTCNQALAKTLEGLGDSKHYAVIDDLVV